MKNKKIKLWKMLIVIIIIIAVIFLISIFRNIVILSSIDSKITEYEKAKNIYSKITSYNSANEFQTVETYKKDDIVKTIIETKKQDGTNDKIIQIIYPTLRKVYFNNIPSENMISYNEDNNGYINNIIINYAKSYNLLEKIGNSVTSKLKTEEVDGKKCYVISILNNSNAAYEVGTTKMLVYIEKENLLPIKILQIINKDGSEIEYLTTCEYKFDNVTDQDLKEPENNQ